MRYFILTLIIIVMFFSCGYSDIKNENLTRPVFESQKIIYLDKAVFEFIPTFYVWNAKYASYMDSRDAKEGTLYKITKKADFSYNSFFVNNLKIKESCSINEEPSEIPGDQSINYNIMENNIKIISIRQFNKTDNMLYEISYNNEKYSLEGKINRTGNIIHSFNFTLKKGDKTFVNIYKEYYYFKNEYEIIINRKEKDFKDITLISIGVFIDQLLKENGYEFRS
jgi:hypothetical protein